jgi:hypothetical protein
MREHEKELEMVADEWRDEVGEARAQVEELKDVSSFPSISSNFSSKDELGKSETFGSMGRDVGYGSEARYQGSGKESPERTGERERDDG